MFVNWQGARHAFAEAVGKNIANPTATLLSACNMLKHIHQEYYALLIQDAIHRVIKAGRVQCVCACVCVCVCVRVCVLHVHCFLCMCVLHVHCFPCVCVCSYALFSICVCTCNCVFACVWLCISFLCMCSCAFLCVCAHACVCVCVCACMCACVCSWALVVCECLFVILDHSWCACMVLHTTELVRQIQSHWFFLQWQWRIAKTCALIWTHIMWISLTSCGAGTWTAYCVIWATYYQ